MTTTAPTSKPRRMHSEPGTVTVSGSKVNGEWEDGELLGQPIEVTGAPNHVQLLYAAQRNGMTYLAAGVRAGTRILRTISMGATRDDGQVQLYGGDVLGERGPDELVPDGTYLVLGTVTGRVTVSVSGPDGRTRPVAASSTTTFPGHTVFYDTGDWSRGWDQVQLAPLTVTTDDGRSAQVREDSWTG